MIPAMIAMFVLGYFLIAVEHKTHVNKAAIAILLAVILWLMYMFSGVSVISGCNAEAFKHFIDANPSLAEASPIKQCAKFVSQFQIVESLGSLTQILLYLLAAMTIVETIDVHNGFAALTDKITTKDKRKLLCVVSFMTFFMSAILDNLTTAIVMTILLRKLVYDQRERWIFTGVMIIAANSGGAWTPMGDVTTIMLWINENVTTIPLISNLFLPSIVSLAVPLLIASIWLGKGSIKGPEYRMPDPNIVSSYISKLERNTIIFIGVGGLLAIPVFKAITGLPPFMGVMIVLGIMWVYVGLMYDAKKGVPLEKQYRITRVFPRLDFATIFFFLGILLAVDALQCAGILRELSRILDTHVHNIYIINPIIGILSSVVDNVPLVAGAMRMYDMPVIDTIRATASEAPAQAAYMMNFVQDGPFWQLLAYCAGTGGSILIIGSAAGVVAMGLEKITFAWYMKKITPLAFAGYAAGIITFLLQKAIF